MRRRFKFKLPPTGNHRLVPIKVNGKIRLATAPKMRAWKKEAIASLEGAEPITTLLGYRIDLYVWWPDRRKRDLDGPVKVIFDALVKAGVISDDAEIRYFSVEDMSTQRQGDDIEPGIDAYVQTVEDWENPF